jgi:hypothetical protein
MGLQVGKLQRVGQLRVEGLKTLRAEDVVLLDPCRGGDPGLLDFHDDGSPCAHPELCESRRQLALQIKAWIDGTLVRMPRWWPGSGLC